ncbi:3'-5' exoribonuclease [Nocardia ignorata]|uniref:Uncharacterized protein DUF5051 n=1 Tax=Nocardia ignorata TaxID=145285 RepID=A0A4R6NZW6_NOCIG|nr:3'-5' exoribonuclease [Nocardia ignorata]TDP29887.1 uncharacterized protein DUF5051 [Nocardia ignorata]
MTLYAYDTEFLEDGRTIELISIGIVCEDGREYYAVNSDMPLNQIKANDWLVRNVLPSLPLNWRTGLDRYLAHPRNTFPKPSIDLVDLDTKSTLVKPKWVIANEVREFLVGDLTPAGELDGRPFYFDTDLPELWADYGAYDHVALAQLWGRMIDLPAGVPMYTNDLQQALRKVPDGFEPPEQTEGQHNALADAKHVLRVLRALDDFEESVADRVDIVDGFGRVIRSEAA